MSNVKPIGWRCLFCGKRIDPETHIAVVHGEDRYHATCFAQSGILPGGAS